MGRSPGQIARTCASDSLIHATVGRPEPVYEISPPGNQASGCSEHFVTRLASSNPDLTSYAFGLSTSAGVALLADG